jgi:hypothetical protein
MVRIARAAEPMLPGWDVRAITKRIVCGAGGMDAVDWFIAQDYPEVGAQGNICPGTP